MDKIFILVLDEELANIKETIPPSTYREYISIGNNRRNMYTCGYRKYYMAFFSVIYSYTAI